MVYMTGTLSIPTNNNPMTNTAALTWTGHNSDNSIWHALSNYQLPQVEHMYRLQLWLCSSAINELPVSLYQVWEPGFQPFLRYACSNLTLNSLLVSITYKASKDVQGEIRTNFAILRGGEEWHGFKVTNDDTVKFMAVKKEEELQTTGQLQNESFAMIT